MSQLATLDANLFDYMDVPADDRGWLQEQEEHIVNYCRRTLADHIRAGEVLLAVQKRVERHFRGWLAAKTPLSRSTAYCLMDVAMQFKSLVEGMSAGRTQNIEVKALYALASPRVKPEVRIKALEAATEYASTEKPYTLKDARVLILSHTASPAVKPSMFKEHEVRRKEIDATECKAEPPQADSRAANAFSLLEELCRETTLLRFSPVDDSEDPDDVLYSGSAHFKADGIPARYATRSSLVDVVEALAGREAQKVCPACKGKLLAEGVFEPEAERRAMRPLNWFNANRSKADGLASECRSCSRPRIKAAKLRKKQPPLAQAA